MPKVGQVNTFCDEKGEQRRNTQARFFNIPTSAVAELEKKCLKLDKSIFKTQQPCTIEAINRYFWIALKVGRKMRF